MQFMQTLCLVLNLSIGQGVLFFFRLDSKPIEFDRLKYEM